MTVYPLGILRKRERKKKGREDYLVSPGQTVADKLFKSTVTRLFFCQLEIPKNQKKKKGKEKSRILVVLTVSSKFIHRVHHSGKRKENE